MAELETVAAAGIHQHVGIPLELAELAMSSILSLLRLSLATSVPVFMSRVDHLSSSPKEN